MVIMKEVNYSLHACRNGVVYHGTLYQPTEQTPGIAFTLGSFWIKLDSTIKDPSGVEVDLKPSLAESQFMQWSLSLSRQNIALFVPTSHTLLLCSLLRTYRETFLSPPRTHDRNPHVEQRKYRKFDHALLRVKKIYGIASFLNNSVLKLVNRGRKGEASEV